MHASRYGEADPARAGGCCLAGRARCPGWSVVYVGEVPCAECWWLAPGAAHTCGAHAMGAPAP